MANLSDKFTTYGLSLATAQVEYLINTSSSTTGSDTSTFAYGSVGQAVLAYSSAGNWVTKRVQALVAISAQDRITLELSEDGNEWTDASNRLPAFESGSAKYGVRVIQVSGSNSQLDIQFGGNGATGTDLWSAFTTWFWRVRVTRANLSAGFGTATATVQGLVQGGTVPGSTSGSAISTGYLGEKITWTSAPINQVLTTSEADWTNATISLTAGTWLITANIYLDVFTGATAGNNTSGYWKLTDSSNTVVQLMDKSLLARTPAAAINDVQTTVSGACVVNISSTTSYKIRAYYANGAGSGGAYIVNQSQARSELFAVRIG